MSSTTHQLFISYLHNNSSARIQSRFDLVTDCIILGFGIDYKRISSLRGCGKIVISELEEHVYNFQFHNSTYLISPENLISFETYIKQNSNAKLKYQLPNILPVINDYGGVPLHRSRLGDIQKRTYTELVFKWSQFSSGNNDVSVGYISFPNFPATLTSSERPGVIEESKVDNFIRFLEHFAPNILKNKLVSIAYVLKYKGSLDLKKHEVDSLGDKSMSIYNKLRREYQSRYPGFNFTLDRDISVFEILSQNEIQNAVRTLNKVYSKSKFNDFRLLVNNASDQLQEFWNLDLDIKYIDNEELIKRYIFLRFWKDTSILNYELYKLFFTTNIDHLTNEGRRVQFVRKYDRTSLPLELIVFNFHNPPDISSMRRVAGVRFFEAEGNIFIYSKKLNQSSFRIDNSIPLHSVKLLANSVNKTYVTKGSHYLLVTKSKKKRNQIKTIIERYVLVNELNNLKSGHITEELNRYGFSYPSNYIPGYVQRMGLNVVQRWDWTWVVRDGQLDIDPKGSISYSDFYTKRIIDDGLSFDQATKELRNFYPNYRIKNALRLISLLKEKSLHEVISKKMLLGRWYDNQESVKRFITQMKYPKSYEGKIVEWPEFLIDDYSVPKLLEFRDSFYWKFELKSQAEYIDLKDHLAFILWNAQVLFDTNDTIYDIDEKEIDFH